MIGLIGTLEKGVFTSADGGPGDDDWPSPLLNLTVTLCLTVCHCVGLSLSLSTVIGTVNVCWSVNCLWLTLACIVVCDHPTGRMGGGGTCRGLEWSTDLLALELAHVYWGDYAARRLHGRWNGRVPVVCRRELDQQGSDPKTLTWGD